MWVSNPSLLKKKVCILSSLLMMHHWARGEFTVRLCPSFSCCFHVFFFFLICAVCRYCLSSLYMFFRGNCSICICSHHVSMRDELRIFLPNHLRPLLPCYLKRCWIWPTQLYGLCKVQMKRWHKVDISTPWGNGRHMSFEIGTSKV